MAQPTDRVVIVTGAGTGIGKGIALAFARAGARLVLAARRRSPLEESAAAVRETGATALVIPTDVTVEAEVIALFEATLAAFGRVDVLVNNSGVFDGGPLDELTLDTWQRVVDVNLTGPFLTSREALRVMKRQKGGRIINIGSISAQMPRVNMAPYTATKHGLVGLTKSTALEGRAFGVSAGCIHPGNVLTERRAASDAPADQEPMMTSDEIASVVLAAAALEPGTHLLEAIVLPLEQEYLGRG